MNKKKDILFVMNNLNVGGAEKALISMLQVFDYKRYNVDLLLFKKEGLFLKQIPNEVKILQEPENYIYFNMPFWQVVKQNFFRLKWDVIFRRFQFKINISKGKNGAEAEQFGWKPLSKTLRPLEKKYDVAIGFLEKNPNYFVVDKVNAKKKIGWIQNDYEALKMNADFDKKYFPNFNFIVANSEGSAEKMKNIFPIFGEKIKVIPNIVSQKNIKALALDKNEKLEFGKIKLVSAGRLNYQKGFDFAIDAAKILKDKVIDFCWYIMGEGEERENLTKQIKKNEVENFVKLLGIRENPYSLIDQATIYVHPSRFEGKSVIVDEIKLLGKTILLTNYPTAKDQIIHMKNGYICEFSPQSIADAIELLIQDENLGKGFSENLLKEKTGYDEIEKLYQLIENVRF